MSLVAPFPYFGGKRAVADQVWSWLGHVGHYVEPFAGSLAVLLGRPGVPRLETVNDADGFLVNVWRALSADPDVVAQWADWPVSELDLTARHAWLVRQGPRLVRQLEADPAWFDAQAAGWWIWGKCCWIGDNWCDGSGPWQVLDDGSLGKLPHLGNPGRGVHRKLPHLGNPGRGVHRQLPHLGNPGRGVQLTQWFRALAERLRSTRISCGDWTRVVTPAVLQADAMSVGVFLDPPYQDGEHAVTYGHTVEWGDVAAWAEAHGRDYRIVLAGLSCDWLPSGWTVHQWTGRGGYNNQGNQGWMDNRFRECLWVSPACLTLPLFADESAG